MSQTQPDCRECWLTATVRSQAAQLRSAWVQLDERPRDRACGCPWWGVVVLMLAMAGLWAWSDMTRAQPHPVPPVPVIAPVLPIVSQRMIVSGKESVMLVRERQAMRIYVAYDGALRGELVRLDIPSRTMMIPSRPPFGWSIGAQ